MFSRMVFPNGNGEHESKYGLANNLLGLPMENLDEHIRVTKEVIDSG